MRAFSGHSGIFGIWPPAPVAMTTNELVMDLSSPFRSIRSVHNFLVESQFPESIVVLVQIF